MPITTFELLSCVVILLTLGAMIARRRDEAGTLLLDYVALAVASWVGEATCIRLYQYYAYADNWHPQIDQVPLLVPLIWPLVILSARDFVDGTSGLRASGSPLGRAIGVAGLVAAVVVFDAALVEVSSVHAGSGSWAEPGHVGVPVFGIVGWGFFAWPAMTLLGSRLPGRHFLVVRLAPLVAHGLIFVSWWGCFRWVGRFDLGRGSLAGLAVLSVAATLSILRWGRPLPLAVAAPRLAATSLFVVVFGLVARNSPALWWCLGCAALPYVVSMVPRGARENDVREALAVEPASGLSSVLPAEGTMDLLPAPEASRFRPFCRSIWHIPSPTELLPGHAFRAPEDLAACHERAGRDTASPTAIDQPRIAYSCCSSAGHHSPSSISTASNGSARTRSSPPNRPSCNHLPSVNRQTSSSRRVGSMYQRWPTPICA